jgi:hypothetical protein
LKKKTPVLETVLSRASGPSDMLRTSFHHNVVYDHTFLGIDHGDGVLTSYWITTFLLFGFFTFRFLPYNILLLIHDLEPRFSHSYETKE